VDPTDHTPDRSYTTNCIWRSVVHVHAVSTAVWRPPRIGSVSTTDGLFTLYTADLTYVVERHGICLHQYADDSQVYVSVRVSDVTTAIHRLAVCVNSINDWMSASRLRLNPMKTEVQVSRLAASTLVTFLGCQQLSRLLSLHVTLASFSMQS